MAIVQAKIKVPDDLMLEIISGKASLKGLVKASDSKRIKKHLDIVSLEDAKSTAAAAVGLSLLVVGAITAVAFAGVRVYQFFSRKKIKDFEVKLNNYVQAVNEQTLTESIIDELLQSMETLLKKTKRAVILKLSTDEFIALINCLCDYTKDLAAANDIAMPDDDIETNGDIFVKFKRNLMVQKSIFQQAA